MIAFSEPTESLALRYRTISRHSVTVRRRGRELLPGLLLATCCASTWSLARCLAGLASLASPTQEQHGTIFLCSIGRLADGWTKMTTSDRVGVPDRVGDVKPYHHSRRLDNPGYF